MAHVQDDHSEIGFVVMYSMYNGQLTTFKQTSGRAEAKARPEIGDFTDQN